MGWVLQGRQPHKNRDEHDHPASQPASQYCKFVNDGCDGPKIPPLLEGLHFFPKQNEVLEMHSEFAKRNNRTHEIKSANQRGGDGGIKPRKDISHGGSQNEFGNLHNHTITITQSHNHGLSMKIRSTVK